MKNTKTNFKAGKILILLFTLLIVNLTLVTEQPKCQWISSLPNLGTLSLTSSTNKIFAGTYANMGVWFSTDNGINWNQTSLSFRTVYSLASKGDTIFAGTDSYGIYCSVNNGQSWNQTNLTNRSVRSILINGNNIYAGTHTYGVYISTDNGNSWTQTSLNNKWIFSLAVKGNTLFAGAQYNGVYISTDNGTTWSNTFPGQTVWAFSVLGNNIYASYGNQGLFYSTDYGMIWQQTALNSGYVKSLATVWNNIFAGTDNYGVFLSTNNGNNWVQHNEGFSGNPSIYALLIYNNYIFAGRQYEGGGIFRRPLSDLITNIQNSSSEIPLKFSLSQNYPNPFNPTTNIKYQIANNSFVTLKIFDVIGREVKTLVNETKSAGSYSVDFNASELSGGVYFYKISAGDFSETKKMLLIK